MSHTGASPNLRLLGTRGVIATSFPVAKGSASILLFLGLFIRKVKRCWFRLEYFVHGPQCAEVPPPSTAVQRHHFSCHYYADDALICAEIPDDPGKAISCLMRCRSDTKSGMSETLLKLRLTFRSWRFPSAAVLHSQPFGFAALGSPVIQNLLQSLFGLNQTPPHKFGVGFFLF